MPQTIDYDAIAASVRKPQSVDYDAIASEIRAAPPPTKAKPSVSLPTSLRLDLPIGLQQTITIPDEVQAPSNYVKPKPEVPLEALDYPKQAAKALLTPILNIPADLVQAAAVIGKEPERRLRASHPEGTPELASPFDKAYETGEKMREGVTKLLPSDKRLESSFWVNDVPSGLGSLAPMLATAALGVPAVGAIASSATMGTQAYKEALQATGDPATAFTAFVANALIGGTEQIPVNRLMGRLKAMNNPATIRALAKNSGITGAEEAIQEGIQNVLSNLSAAQFSAHDPNRPLTQDMLRSMAAGFVVGATGAAGAGGVFRLTAKPSESKIKFTAELMERIKAEAKPTVVEEPPTSAAEVASDTIPEEKPPSTPEALPVVGEIPEAGATVPSTVKNFHSETTALKHHEVRGGLAQGPHLPQPEFRKKLIASAEAATPLALTDFAGGLRKVAERHAPDVIPQIEKAENSLAAGDVEGFAIEAEIARAELSSAYQTATTNEQAARILTPEDLARYKAVMAVQVKKPHFLSETPERMVAEPVPATKPKPQKLTEAETGKPFSAKLLRGQGRSDSPYNPLGAQVPILGEGLYLTDSREYAGHFGPNITEHQVDLKNPLVIGDDAQWRKLTREAGWEYANPFGGDPSLVPAQIKALLGVIKGKGHDGVIITIPDRRYGDQGKTLENVFGADQVIAFAESKTRAFDSEEMVPSELPELSEIVEPDGPVDISFDFSDDVDGLKDGDAPPSPSGETPRDRSGERGSVKIGAILRSTHNIRQAIFEATEKLGERGLTAAGDAIGRLYEKITPEGVQERMEGWFGMRPESYKLARRDFRGVQAEVREAAEKLGDRLIAALPTPESRTLAAKLAQNEATPKEVLQALKDPEIMAAAQFVKDEFKRLGEAIIQEGVGKYGKLDVESRQALIDVMKGQRKIASLDPEIRDMANSSISKYFGEYLPRLYRSKEAMGVLKKYGLSVKRVRQEFSRLKQRNVDLSPDVREALGEITEIIEPGVKGIFQEEMMLAKNRFFQQIAKDPALTMQLEPPPGMTQKAQKEWRDLKVKVGRPLLWKTLPDSELLGPLAGQTVAPSVYRDMMEIVQAPGQAKKILQTFNRMIKKGKTAYNPATQVRNYGSNWVTRDAVGGMDIATQAFRDPKAFRSIIYKDSTYRNARRDGLFETDYAGLDLAKIRMNELPSVPQKGISGAVDGVARMFEAIAKVDDAVTWAYRMGDDVPKLAMYDWLVNVKHMDSKAAVARVLDVLPDFSEVAPIIEKARRSLIGPTFVSYQSIAVPRFARSILKHPLRAGKYVVLGSMVSRLLVEYGLKTQKETEDERREMPGYMKPKLGGIISPFMPLPFKDSTGRSLYMDLTYTLPFGDAMESSGLFGLPPVFDIGIMPRTFLDVGRNSNNYGSYIRGEPVQIYDNTDSGIEKGKKVGAYIGGQLLPSLTPKLGYGARRLESAVKKTPSYYGDAPQDLKLAAAQVLAGGKTVAIDLDAEAAARVRDVEGKIRDIQGRISSAKRNQQLSEEEREKLIRDRMADLERVVKAYEER